MLRTIGILLVILGGLVAASWFIEPIRTWWPLAWAWFLALPAVFRWGGVIALLGGIVIMTSLLVERARDREAEGDLTDEL